MLITATVIKLGVTAFKAYKVYTTANVIKKVVLDEPVSARAARGFMDRSGDALGVLFDGDSDDSMTGKALNVASKLCGI